MTAATVTAGLGDTSHIAGQTARKPGFWTRMRAAIVRARMRQAEREIAAYLELNGGRFTDQIERRILDRVSGIDHRGLGA
jgi:hypothetical protein